jgi:hypothetical protein
MSITLSGMSTASAVSQSDLIEVAVPNVESETGYDSKKNSLSNIANSMANAFTYNGLDTTDKTIVGAINEALTKTGGYVELTETLEAGETSVYFTSDVIKTSSMVDFYTNVYGVAPSSVNITNGSIEAIFGEREDDLIVKVRIMDPMSESGEYHSGSIVEWNQITVGGGTKIAEITIDGDTTEVFAPADVQYNSAISGGTTIGTLVVGGNRYTLYTPSTGTGQWTDLVSTLEAGETELVINNNIITVNSSVEIFTDIYGVSPSNVVVEDGKVTLTFTALDSDLGVKVRVS